MLASVKLEDSDVSGAVRLLCTVMTDWLLRMRLRSSNSAVCPPQLLDRRSESTTDALPLQVSPSAVRAAIQSFPNGSAAGPDGLRAQHLKDLLLGAPDDNQLLSAVTDLTNLLLEGKIPPSVRVPSFGGNV